MGRPKGSVKTPTYRMHKATGQAVVTISGRDYYLGTFGTRQTSPESWDKYDRLIGEWLARGRQGVGTTPPETVTIREVRAAYWTWATAYYANGSTNALQVIRDAMH